MRHQNEVSLRNVVFFGISITVVVTKYWPERKFRSIRFLAMRLKWQKTLKQMCCFTLTFNKRIYVKRYSLADTYARTYYARNT